MKRGEGVYEHVWLRTINADQGIKARRVNQCTTAPTKARGWRRSPKAPN
jgi:hypothetical protein